MKVFSSELIRPLSVAENSFLQVLISQFSLKRNRSGVELEIHFNNTTPAIWTGQAKHELLGEIGDFKRKSKKYQTELDRLLLSSEEHNYVFNDPGFPFRYASGGTLPIVRIGSSEYYCLFYRDIFPIGWNIANGGCDSREELLNPLITIERELREELIILDVNKEKRYVFEADAGKPLDRPEFETARRIWKRRFSRVNIANFEELTIPIKWLSGPDTVTVHFENAPSRKIAGCFLNINAEDYGIEIDKIAKINLSEDVILCDGELENNCLINRPIGLFEVNKFNRNFETGAKEYVPERFYYGGKLYKRERKADLLGKCIQTSIQSIRSNKEITKWMNTKNKFILCPVTRGIIQRYISYCTKKPAEKTIYDPFSLFISFGGEDEQFAAHVYNYFENKGIRTFFSKESTDVNYSGAIDEALDDAHFLIAVSTNPQSLFRPWPEYEWRRFHMDIRCGKKIDAKMVSFISNFHPVNLPGPLRFYQSVVFDMKKINEGLKTLARYVLGK